MVSVISELNEIVTDLKATKVVDAVAVIRRDGILMASNFPQYSMGNEVFAMMSATIIGAAKNITQKSSMGMPSRITIHTKDGNIIIASAGPKALLVCLIKDSKDPSLLSEALEATGAKVNAVI